MWARVREVFRVRVCEREFVRVTGGDSETVWSAVLSAESEVWQEQM